MAQNLFRPKNQGTVIPQAVTMYIDNDKKILHGWESLNITKNLDSIAHGFSFSVPQKFDLNNSSFKLFNGTVVSVFVNDQIVMRGRIEKPSISLSSGDRGVEFSGRSFAGDLVDCSIETTFEYNDIDFRSFVSKLISPFGIKAFYSVNPKKISKIAAKPGDTVFEVLDKAARLQGFLWISTRNGNIRLTRAGIARSVSRIEQGINLKSGSVEIDGSQRFSKYIVKGQTNGLDNFPGKSASAPQGVAFDNGVGRYRPLIIIAEGNVDSELAKSRAQWEASVRLAKSTMISLTVQGWLQQTGIIWGLNQIINVKSKTLEIDGDFLATSLEYVRDNSQGTVTRIGLTRKDAYVPQPTIKENGEAASSVEKLDPKVDSAPTKLFLEDSSELG